MIPVTTVAYFGFLQRRATTTVCIVYNISCTDKPYFMPLHGLVHTLCEMLVDAKLVPLGVPPRGAVTRTGRHRHAQLPPPSFPPSPRVRGLPAAGGQGSFSARGGGARRCAAAAALRSATPRAA